MTTALGRRIASQQSFGSVSTTPPAITVHYLKLLQVWQWGNTTLQSVLDQARSYGFTGLLVKALDGPNWMGDFDDSPDALSSVTDVQRQAGVAHSQGMYYFAWTNPRQFQIQLQTDLTAEVANACDGVLLDIEPYTQFWGPWAPIGLAAQFMTLLREKAPRAYIGLQPDPRVSALASLRISEWVPLADSIWGQHYWNDFQSDPTEELVHAAALGMLYSMPVLPTLPGNGTGFPLDAISKFPGFAVWRSGTTPEATLALLGQLPVAGTISDKLAKP